MKNWFLAPKKEHLTLLFFVEYFRVYNSISYASSADRLLLNISTTSNFISFHLLTFKINNKSMEIFSVILCEGGGTARSFEILFIVKYVWIH